MSIFLLLNNGNLFVADANPSATEWVAEYPVVQGGDRTTFNPPKLAGKNSTLVLVGPAALAVIKRRLAKSFPRVSAAQPSTQLDAQTGFFLVSEEPTCIPVTPGRLYSVQDAEEAVVGQATNAGYKLAQGKRRATTPGADAAAPAAAKDADKKKKHDEKKEKKKKDKEAKKSGGDDQPANAAAPATKKTESDAKKSGDGKKKQHKEDASPSRSPILVANAGGADDSADDSDDIPFAARAFSAAKAAKDKAASDSAEKKKPGRSKKDK